jgi:hypothetical protein
MNNFFKIIADNLHFSKILYSFARQFLSPQGNIKAKYRMPFQIIYLQRFTGFRFVIRKFWMKSLRVISETQKLF